MKKLYPYEQSMADKLQQLPARGEDDHWLQMKAMLDKEMPRGAIAVLLSSIKGAKWLSVFLLSGMIILGVVLQQYFKTNDNKVQAISTIENTGAAADPATIKDSDEKNTQSAIGSNPALKNAASPDKVNREGAANAHTIAPELKTISIAETGTNKNGEAADLNKQEKGTLNKSITHKNGNATNVFKDPLSQKNTSGSRVPTGVRNNPAPLTLSNNLLIDDKATETTTGTKLAPGKELIPAAIYHKRMNDGYTAAGPAGTFTQPIVYNGKADKGLKIPVEVVSRKERKELKRSFKNVDIKNQGTHLSFAAGLLLPASMSLSAQQKPGYNINATSNMITDYLPAPYLQYHINNKLFLHSELQFQSPQFTNRLLLSQNTQVLSPASGIQNNIYAEKLYYFNIPVSVHYSLFNNFFIGTGVQFSSLISGVAGYEQRAYDGAGSSITKYQAGRFQDDSLSNMLRPSDFRWQMDAQYYIKRFTMGARYNRALNNVIDVQVGNTKTQARNQSLQLYVRYNLWEEKRK